MKLSDFCRRVPEIGRHLKGLAADNAGAFVGKAPDKATKEDIEKREGEVNHQTFWGGHVSDKLRKMNHSCRAYTLAHRASLMAGGKTPKELEEKETLQKNLSALQVETARLFIAMRICQYVEAKKSDELPEINNVLVNLGNGMMKPLLSCDEGHRLPGLTAWANDMYRSAILMSDSSAGEGFDILRELGEIASPVVEEALASAENATLSVNSRNKQMPQKEQPGARA